MSRHIAVELLSSYLDAEVSRAELRLVEGHLDECSECRRTVAGLRAVSESVRRLEAVAPPASLASSVERRVERAALEAGRGYGFEESLKRWAAQPVLAPVFAIVLALGAILYMFAFGVARDESNRTRLVIASAPVEDETGPLSEVPRKERIASDEAAEAPSAVQEQRSNTPAAPESEDRSAEGEPVAAVGALETLGAAARVPPARHPGASAKSGPEPFSAMEADRVAPARELGGRRFLAHGATWVESGLESATAEEVLDWRRLAEPDRSELEAFRELGRVRVTIDGRVVEVVYSEAETPSE